MFKEYIIKRFFNTYDTSKTRTVFGVVLTIF